MIRVVQQSDGGEMPTLQLQCEDVPVPQDLDKEWRIACTAKMPGPLPCASAVHGVPVWAAVPGGEGRRGRTGKLARCVVASAALGD
jgi:hypothetical protein